MRPVACVFCGSTHFATSRPLIRVVKRFSSAMISKVHHSSARTRESSATRKRRWWGAVGFSSHTLRDGDDVLGFLVKDAEYPPLGPILSVGSGRPGADGRRNRT